MLLKQARLLVYSSNIRTYANFKVLRKTKIMKKM